MHAPERRPGWRRGYRTPEPTQGARAPRPAGRERRGGRGAIAAFPGRFDPHAACRSLPRLAFPGLGRP